MKKITLGLLFASFASGLFGQVDINVVAPPYNSSTEVRLPNGTITHKTLRGCFIVTKSELETFTASDINSISFIRRNGKQVSASNGTIAVYIENTTDATYNKGTDFLNAISTMSLVHSGAFQVPTSQATATLTLPFTGAYGYNGDGLYIAYEWEEATPAVNTNTFAADYAAHNSGAGNNMSAIAQTTAAPASNTMILSEFRPVCIFNGKNTATNELEIIDMDVPGVVSLHPGGHTMRALVRNNSTVPLSNITVTLAVAGANSFADSKVITSIAPGAIETVTFDPFTPTTLGTNTVVMAALTIDQYTLNNVRIAKQEVTCIEIGMRQSAPSNSFTNNFAGAGGTRLFAFKQSIAVSDASVTAISAVIPGYSGAMNSGKSIFPAVLDKNGVIVAQGPNYLVGAMDVWVNIPLGQAYPLIPGEEYYFGVGMTVGGHYPIGLMPPLPMPMPTLAYRNYYSFPAAGGTGTQIFDFGHFAIGAILSYTSPSAPEISASKTVVCKADRAPITLTASGAPSYQWLGLSSSQATVNVTPTIAATATAGVITYTVRGNYNGCYSENSTIQFQVEACTAALELDNYADISVFPNPATNGKVNVNGLQGKNNIMFINTLGQVVLNRETEAGNTEVDVNTLAPGNYLLRITDDQHRVKTVKFSKQ